MDESDRSKMEYQAYMFAGMILVPKEILRAEFNKQLTLIQSHIEQAQSNGISREDYLPVMTDAIANVLSPKFEVSRSVLIKRIQFERFDQEIP
jgi:Zn-dependent peptidase ImmA (M78 family)